MDEGSEDCFIWENQRWPFSNSDNSGGNNVKPVDKKLPYISDGQQLTVPNAVARETEVAGNGEGNERKANGGELDHDIHIWTERERRKKMRNMFSNLHALLPQLHPKGLVDNMEGEGVEKEELFVEVDMFSEEIGKADKYTIVDEAVNYIKTLQHTLVKLQREKLERLHGMNPSKAAIGPRNNPLSLPHFPAVFQTWTSPNVILNVCGEEAHISVCCPKKKQAF